MGVLSHLLGITLMTIPMVLSTTSLTNTENNDTYFINLIELFSQKLIASL